MNEYKFNFRVFGHKFSTTIKADTKYQALIALHKRIATRTEIDDIQEVKDPNFESVKDLFKKSGLDF